MYLPEYHSGSIVNLLSSIQLALGAKSPLYAPLPQLPPERLAPVTNIVLIVIDGLGYTYLTRRHADSFRKHLVGRITSVFPSTTAAAVTSFFTGTAPQQHALTGWFTYFKELGAVIAPLPFRPRYGGTSLNDLVNAQDLFDQQSLFDRIRRRGYVTLPKRIVDSDYTRAMSGTAARLAYGSVKDYFHCIAEIIRANRDSKYVYAYWPELDSLAHMHGIGSPQAATHLEELDYGFSRFLQAVKGTGTTVIVTADHGIIDSESAKLISLEQHSELAETLVLPLCGEPRAAFCYVHPGRQQQFEQYVRTQFAESAELHRSVDLVERGYFGLGEPDSRLYDRIGTHTLIMKDHYVIKDWLLGERHYEQAGVHGGLSEEEMYVPLIVCDA
ncbi:MAG: alkaline phosphatase family protein [Acidiferrobacterales bacterium]